MLRPFFFALSGAAGHGSRTEVSLFFRDGLACLSAYAHSQSAFQKRSYSIVKGETPFFWARARGFSAELRAASTARGSSLAECVRRAAVAEGAWCLILFLNVNLFWTHEACLSASS